jgi:hypothetical protein
VRFSSSQRWRQSASSWLPVATYGGGGGGSPLQVGAVSYANDLVQPRPQRDRVM